MAVSSEYFEVFGDGWLRLDSHLCSLCIGMD